MELTDQQKAEIRGILGVGCDRQTAADYIGCTLADMRTAMQTDATFLAEVRHEEARIELKHMQNVHDLATGKKRDWKASVWWLERRSPERFGRRSAGVVTPPQLKAFLAIIVEVLKAEVKDVADCERVVGRLTSIAETVDQLLRDAKPGPIQPLPAFEFEFDDEEGELDAEFRDSLRDDLSGMETED